MRATRLHPEKITHPFQLMAAWFAMLIILVATLLTAAAKIESPAWVPGFLAISSIGISIVVMTAVFLMLTRFRPHLQGAKEYAEWLKDERRYVGRSVERLEVRQIIEKAESVLPTATPRLGDLEVFRAIATHPVTISRLRRADEVLGRLQKLGFQASIYTGIEGGAEYLVTSEHSAIWVGSRVPGNVAILSIKTVLNIWPHLCYLHLSEDGASETPDYVHDQMYLGGATSTALKYGLERWSVEEILRIADDVSTAEFHRLIRMKYGQTGRPAKMLGG